MRSRCSVMEEIFRSFLTSAFLSQGLTNFASWGATNWRRSLISCILNCCRSSFVITSISILHSFLLQKVLEEPEPLFRSQLNGYGSNRHSFAFTRGLFFWLCQFITGRLFYHLFLFRLMTCSLNCSLSFGAYGVIWISTKTKKPANSTICRLLVCLDIDLTGPDGSRTHLAISFKINFL